MSQPGESRAAGVGVEPLAGELDATDDLLMWRLLDSAPDAIVVVDATGRLLLVNETAETLFGLDRVSLLGSDVESVLPGWFAAASGLRGDEAGPVPQPPVAGDGVRMTAKRADGSECVVEVRLRSVRTDRGACLVATLHRSAAAVSGEVGARGPDRGEVAADLYQQIALELHDLVAQRLFAAGLGTQSLLLRLDDPQARDRVAAIVDELDAALRDVRRAAFGLRV
jgi:PAS domain S-box-containing protein